MPAVEFSARFARWSFFDGLVEIVDGPSLFIGTATVVTNSAVTSVLQRDAWNRSELLVAGTANRQKDRKNTERQSVSVELDDEAAWEINLPRN